jgi:hypothetical protein
VVLKTSVHSAGRLNLFMAFNHWHIKERIHKLSISAH